VVGGEWVPVVENLDVSVRSGQVVGLVGESGSGKSVTCYATMGLVDHQHGRVAGGEIVFDGRDLRSLTDRQMADLRGNDLAMIFQEPMTSLNPAFTIGQQISEVVRRHR